MYNIIIRITVCTIDINYIIYLINYSYVHVLVFISSVMPTAEVITVALDMLSDLSLLQVCYTCIHACSRISNLANCTVHVNVHNYVQCKFLWTIPIKSYVCMYIV